LTYECSEILKFNPQTTPSLISPIFWFLKMGEIKTKNALHLESALSFQLILTKHGSKLIPIHQHAAFVAILADLAGDHFHRHADTGFFFTHIRQLRGDRMIPCQNGGNKHKFTQPLFPIISRPD
jgi:hypothetical protein